MINAITPEKLYPYITYEGESVNCALRKQI